MSRSSTPFSDTGSDVFFPTIKRDDDFYGESTHLYEDDHQLKFTASGDLVLDFQDGTIAPTNTRAGTRTSTPDFVETVATPEMDYGEYNYELQSEAYSSPDEVETHSYPLRRREALYRKHSKHSMAARSTAYDLTHPDTSVGRTSLQNFARIRLPSHRHSLSDSDAGRIIHSLPAHRPELPRYPYPDQRSNANQQPTFFRLRETRSRPLPKANGDDSSHKRSRGRRGRPSMPTSIPIAIGSPLSSDHAVGSTAGNVPLRGPVLVHMPHSVQRNMSQRVIEVGAMAVLNIPKENRKTEKFVDPRLLDLRGKMERSAAPSPEMIVEPKEGLKNKWLKDLDNMQERLKEGRDTKGVEDGLKGCEMIRAALAKMEDHDSGVEKKSNDDGLSNEEDDSELERMLRGSPKLKQETLEL
ncbi:hypothetical protein N0V90_001281 [Kalmusia sp. IMI 367209]|nr:hypothetical protein N0V90_001281 [Kalmusia sp. IMI 367209]